MSIAPRTTGPLAVAALLFVNGPSVVGELMCAQPYGEPELVFQLTAVSEQDERDMKEILGDFEALVGNAVRATVDRDVRRHREISPHDGVRWLFLSRVADDD